MEVRFPNSVDAVGRAYLTRPAAREAKATQEDVAFENSRALRTKLENTPALRAEALQRARELVGDVNYPPAETIQKISNLLALHIQDQQAAQEKALGH